jgi:predicted acetyltransferase
MKTAANGDLPQPACILSRLLPDDEDTMPASCALQLLELPDGGEIPRLPNRVRWLWDGQFAGQIGLRWQVGTDALPDHVLGHIGFAVVPWKRRRGYATEALARMLPMAREVGLKLVEITTDTSNTASQRVIEANGGRLIGEFVNPRFGPAHRLRYVIDVAGQ